MSNSTTDLPLAQIMREAAPASLIASAFVNFA